MSAPRRAPRRVSRRSSLLRALALAPALALVLGAASACAPRQVSVTTGAPADAAASLEFTNNLAQAVNVYVRANGGAEIFLRQVPARSTETIPVRGIAAGRAVTLRAAPVDGSGTSYTQENVTLGRGVVWRVP